jgi:hypothetical protein
VAYSVLRSEILLYKEIRADAKTRDELPFLATDSFFFGAICHPARSVAELAGPVEFRDFDSETGNEMGMRATSG